MTDERLRELERRWKVSGAIDDEVELLRERSRRGDLMRANLELAAYLGAEAAVRCGFPAIPGAVEHPDWVAAVRAASFTAYLRALVAVAQRWPTRADGSGARDVPRIELEICSPIVSGQTARVGPDPRSLPALERYVAEVADEVPTSELRGAVRDELVPWLLGHDDPVAQRVASHLRG